VDCGAIELWPDMGGILPTLDRGLRTDVCQAGRRAVKQADLPGAGGLHGGQGWRRAWDGPELARVRIHHWN
jgi:hypothetical protein